MLPVFTTQQVKDGIDYSDLMLDLSDYMKKKDAATKTELETLTAVVANKLDKQPQHKHIIEDVDQLQTVLDTKFNKNNVEQIPFIERPRVEILEISQSKSVWGYRFYVDNSGNLVIISPNDNEIASYSNSSGKWSFETDLTDINNTLDNLSNSLQTNISETNTVLENHAEALNAVCNATLINITDIETNATKINSVESIINEYIAKTDAVLKNHYNALLLLCEKHGMVDGDGDGASNITPTDD